MGGNTTIQQPSPPPAPSTADAYNAYIAGLPAMYNAQLTYAPRFAQQQMDLTAQIAPQAKALQDALYPQTSALQEGVASQARAGMSSEMPESMKQAYQDQFRSEVGSQAGSGLGADYVSRNMYNAGQARQDYFRNLALTTTGRQPLYQSSGYTPPNMAQGYNFGQVQNAMQQGYGNYSGAYSSMYGANANLAGMNYQSQMGLYGAGMGAMGTFMASSKTFKNETNDKVDGVRVLRNTKIVTYRYKPEIRNVLHDDGKVHVGVFAEDVPEILASKDRKSVDVINAIGVIMDAVKRIDERLGKIEFSRRSKNKNSCNNPNSDPS